MNNKIFKLKGNKLLNIILPIILCLGIISSALVFSLAALRKDKEVKSNLTFTNGIKASVTNLSSEKTKFTSDADLKLIATEYYSNGYSNITTQVLNSVNYSKIDPGDRIKILNPTIEPDLNTIPFLLRSKWKLRVNNKEYDETNWSQINIKSMPEFDPTFWKIGGDGYYYVFSDDFEKSVEGLKKLSNLYGESTGVIKFFKNDKLFIEIEDDVNKFNYNSEISYDYSNTNAELSIVLTIELIETSYYAMEDNYWNPPMFPQYSYKLINNNTELALVKYQGSSEDFNIPEYIETFVDPATGITYSNLPVTQLGLAADVLDTNLTDSQTGYIKLEYLKGTLKDTNLTNDQKVNEILKQIYKKVNNLAEPGSSSSQPSSNGPQLAYEELALAKQDEVISSYLKSSKTFNSKEIEYLKTLVQTIDSSITENFDTNFKSKLIDINNFTNESTTLFTSESLAFLKELYLVAYPDDTTYQNLITNLTEDVRKMILDPDQMSSLRSNSSLHTKIMTKYLVTRILDRKHDNELKIAVQAFLDANYSEAGLTADQVIAEMNTTYQSQLEEFKTWYTGTYKQVSGLSESEVKELYNYYYAHLYNDTIVNGLINVYNNTRNSGSSGNTGTTNPAYEELDTAKQDEVIVSYLRSSKVFTEEEKEYLKTIVQAIDSSITENFDTAFKQMLLSPNNFSEVASEILTEIYTLKFPDDSNFEKIETNLTEEVLKLIVDPDQMSNLRQDSDMHNIIMAKSLLNRILDRKHDDELKIAVQAFLDANYSEAGLTADQVIAEMDTTYQSQLEEFKTWYPSYKPVSGLTESEILELYNYYYAHLYNDTIVNGLINVYNNTRNSGSSGNTGATNPVYGELDTAKQDEVISSYLKSSKTFNSKEIEYLKTLVQTIDSSITENFDTNFKSKLIDINNFTNESTTLFTSESLAFLKELYLVAYPDDTTYQNLITNLTEDVRKMILDPDQMSSLRSNSSLHTKIMTKYLVTRILDRKHDNELKIAVQAFLDANYSEAGLTADQVIAEMNTTYQSQLEEFKTWYTGTYKQVSGLSESEVKELYNYYYAHLYNDTIVNGLINVYNNTRNSGSSGNTGTTNPAYEELDTAKQDEVIVSYLRSSKVFTEEEKEYLKTIVQAIDSSITENFDTAFKQMLLSPNNFSEVASEILTEIYTLKFPDDSNFEKIETNLTEEVLKLIVDPDQMSNLRQDSDMHNIIMAKSLLNRILDRKHDDELKIAVQAFLDANYSEAGLTADQVIAEMNTTYQSQLEEFKTWYPSYKPVSSLTESEILELYNYYYAHLYNDTIVNGLIKIYNNTKDSVITPTQPEQKEFNEEEFNAYFENYTEEQKIEYIISNFTPTDLQKKAINKIIDEKKQQFIIEKLHESLGKKFNIFDDLISYLQVFETRRTQSTFSSLTIPKHIKKIGAYAFSSLNHLMEVDIFCSSLTIGYKGFYNCPTLKYINFKSENDNTLNDLVVGEEFVKVDNNMPVFMYVSFDKYNTIPVFKNLDISKTYFAMVIPQEQFETYLQDPMYLEMYGKYYNIICSTILEKDFVIPKTVTINGEKMRIYYGINPLALITKSTSSILDAGTKITTPGEYYICYKYYPVRPGEALEDTSKYKYPTYEYGNITDNEGNTHYGITSISINSCSDNEITLPLIDDFDGVYTAIGPNVFGGNKNSVNYIKVLHNISYIDPNAFSDVLSNGPIILDVTDCNRTYPNVNVTAQLVDINNLNYNEKTIQYLNNGGKFVYTQNFISGDLLVSSQEVTYKDSANNDVSTTLYFGYTSSQNASSISSYIDNILNNPSVVDTSDADYTGTYYVVVQTNPFVTINYNYELNNNGTAADSSDDYLILTSIEKIGNGNISKIEIPDYAVYSDGNTYPVKVIGDNAFSSYSGDSNNLTIILPETITKLNPNALVTSSYSNGDGTTSYNFIGYVVLKSKTNLCDITDSIFLTYNNYWDTKFFVTEQMYQQYISDTNYSTISDKLLIFKECTESDNTLSESITFNISDVSQTVYLKWYTNTSSAGYGSNDHDYISGPNKTGEVGYYYAYLEGSQPTEIKDYEFDYELSTDGTYATVIYKSGNSVKLDLRNIETTYQGVPVTHIKGFGDLDRLQTLILSSNINYIDAVAFKNCTNLQNIIFAENTSFLEIGQEAFYKIYPYNSELTIPSYVTVIGDRAFATTSDNRIIRFEENSNLTTIGSNVFSYIETDSENNETYNNEKFILLFSSSDDALKFYLNFTEYRNNIMFSKYFKEGDKLEYEIIYGATTYNVVWYNSASDKFWGSTPYSPSNPYDGLDDSGKFRWSNTLYGYVTGTNNA